MSGPQRFVITVDGRRHDVEVDAPPGSPSRTAVATVRVDGRACRVLPVPGGELLVRAEDEGPQHKVSLAPGAAPRSASIAGRAFAVLVRTARQAAADESAQGAAGSGGARASVEAPMPGRVVKVLVEEDAVVKAGAPLFIIEAMKMENEVHAVSGGRVTQLDAKPGATVDPGHVLCVIEPEPEPEPEPR